MTPWSSAPVPKVWGPDSNPSYLCKKWDGDRHRCDAPPWQQFTLGDWQSNGLAPAPLFQPAAFRLKPGKPPGAGGAGLGSTRPPVWRHNRPPQSWPLATDLATVSVAAAGPRRLVFPNLYCGGQAGLRTEGTQSVPREGCGSTKHGWQPER